MHKHGKMNQAFKLVWSEARGRYIVAPESAKGQGKSSRSVDGVLRNALLAFSGLLFFGYGAGVGATQPATTVVPVSGNTSTYIAPNGVPVVNINTANGAGVSNNVYSTFNVENKGLVLNNWAPDRGTTGQSQLAGALVFNPNLDREAKVILNQVNSTNPSVLKGFMEVHGGTADLVVANPNGIACDGCGVINTNHLTLTTGTPYLEASGALGGFDVTRGGIQVTGAGLNGSQAAQVDLVARSIVLDGGVSASANGTLQLIVGANRWRYADGAIEAALVPAAGDAPAYAVDSTVFGGVSAGKIRITASDAGIGVRMDGSSAAGKDGFVINANGQIEVLGSVSGEKDVQLSGVGRVLVGPQAQVLSNGTLGVQGQSLSNQGDILGQGDVTITASAVDNVGKIEGGNALKVSTTELINRADGHLGARSGLVEVQAQNIQNAGTVGSTVQHVNLQAQRLQNSGTIVGADVQLGVQAALENSGSVVSMGPLQVTAASIANQADGRIHSDTQARLTATNGNIENRGVISAEGALALSSTGQVLVRPQGDVLSNGTLSVDAKSLVNTGDVLGQGRVDVTVDVLDNVGSIEGGSLLKVVAQDIINRAPGYVPTEPDYFVRGGYLGAREGLVDVQAQNIQNAGTIGSTVQRVDLKADRVQNSGTVVGADVKIGASESMDNNGSLIGLGPLEVTAGRITNQIDGGIYSRTQAQLTATSGNIENRGSMFAEEHLMLTAMAGKVDNQSTADAAQGFMGSEGDLTVKAKAFENRSEVSVTGDIHISADTFLNTVHGDTTRVIDSTKATANAVQTHHDEWYSFPDKFSRTYYQKDWTETERLVGGVPKHKPLILSGGNVVIDNFTSAANIGGVMSVAGNLSTIGKAGSGATLLNDDLSLKTTYMRETWSHYMHYVALGPLVYTDNPDYLRTSFATNVTQDNSIGAGIFVGNTFTATGTHIANAGAQYNGSPLTPMPGSLQDPDLDLAALMPTSTNGRFVLAVQYPGAKYLVEYNQFYLGNSALLGSDYLAQALGLDMDTLAMRLGDPNYEAYLVRQQLLAKTGTVFQGDRDAAGNQLSEAQQMQKMWTAAADAKAGLNLVWGEPLSDAQVGQLTQNITWMVKENVNGQDVLVPRVYLSPKSTNQINEGAVITARHVNLEDVTSVSNLGGVIKGDQITIRSQGDVRNMSGVIDGGSVDITSTQGKVINETVQTFGNGATVEAVKFETGVDKTETQNVYVNGEYHTTTGKTAGIRATNADGHLNITAEGGILVKGAALASAGDASLTTTGAQGDIRFETIQDIQGHVVRANVDGDGGMKGGYQNTTVTTTTHTGSSANIGGKLTINSARDVSIQGSQINADALEAKAAGNFEVLAVHDSTTVARDSQSTSVMDGSLYSARETTERGYNSKVVGSGLNIAGKASIEADTITVKGSSVNADQGLALMANKVEVLEDHDKNYTFKQEKVFDALTVGAGGIATAMDYTELMGTTTADIRNAEASVGYVARLATPDGWSTPRAVATRETVVSPGVLPASTAASAGAGASAHAGAHGDLHLNRETVTTSYTATTKGVSSSLGSANGEVLITGRTGQANNNAIKIVGSDVKAESIRLEGQKIEVLAGQDTDYSRTHSISKSIGAFAEVDANAGAGASAAANAAAPAAGAGAHAQAAASGVVTLGTRTQEYAHMKEKTDVRASTLTATGGTGGNRPANAGNIEIVATGGDVLFKGADVTAARDIRIEANNITNETAQSTTLETSSVSVKTSGFYLDGGVSAGARAAADIGLVTPQAVGVLAGTAKAEVSLGHRSAVSEASHETLTVVNTGNKFKSGGDVTRNATNTLSDAATLINAGGNINQTAQTIVEKEVHDVVMTSSSSTNSDTRIGMSADVNATGQIGGHVGVGALGGDHSGGNARAQVKADGGIGIQASTQTDKAWSSSQTKTAVVSGYTAGGKISSTSTGDTTLVGSVFKAGGDINVTSTEGSVSYLAAKDVQSTKEKVEKESGSAKLTLVGNVGFDGSLNTMGVEHQQTLTTGIAGNMTSTNGSVNVSAQKDVTLQGVKVDAAKDVNIEAREGSVTLSAAETTRETIASSNGMSIGGSVSILSLMDAERGTASVNVSSYTQSSVSRQQTGGSIDAKGDVNIRSKGDQTLVGTTIDATNISLASENGRVNRVDARHEEHTEQGGFQIGVASTATPTAIGKGSIRSTSTGAIEFGGPGVTTGVAPTLNAKNDLSIRESSIGAGSLP